MKIRILNNSIRLRLSQPEINSLLKGEMVEGKLSFPKGGSWKYQLTPKKQDPLFEIQYTGDGINLLINSNEVEGFSSDDVIANESTLSTPDGALKILVEKGCKCLSSREEDQSQLFAHPDEGEFAC